MPERLDGYLDGYQEKGRDDIAFRAIYEGYAGGLISKLVVEGVYLLFSTNLERIASSMTSENTVSCDAKEGEEGSWNIERPTDVFIAAAAAAAAGGGGGLKCFGTDHFDFPGIAAAYWRNSQTKKL
ncbi:hypothetical protein LOAG_00336 [Loa loa]|uniref:Uncharacterized protein n=1 Tax=Loa loa TaxID=7209 RepID=A0A1S0UBN3_LOALO|nr:hypothetical protein LOAG_00336 [Loa loa]EFO28130.1 hypothetical protein LOAG_00336 [Loa loa]